MSRSSNIPQPVILSIITFTALFGECTVSTSSSSSSSTAHHHQSPNFLFLMVDSMDGRLMDPTNSLYATMSMPNLRSIANEGTQFLNHYTNSPQCVPGRTVLFTGRRIDQIRTYSNQMGIALFVNQSKADPNCIECYGNATCFKLGKKQNVNYTLLSGLEEIGYKVHLNGRMDVGAGIIALHHQQDSDADGFHHGPRLGIVTSSANIQRSTKKNPIDLVNSSKDRFNSDQKRVTACIDRIDKLKHHKSPWFMQCSLLLPHPPFYAKDQWLNEVNVSDIAMPVWINESSFHPYDQFMSISKSGWGNFNESDIKRLRKTYYGMNVEADYLLGEVIKAMNRNGYNLSNTIMYFTSDHGEMNMDHRQIWKNSMYEGSSRVPLFFAGPGIERGVLVTNPTQSIDVLPTIIHLATGNKKHIPSWLSGNTLVPFLKGKGSSYTEYPSFITSQYHSNMGNTGAFMVRWNNYKYIQFGHYLTAYKDYEPQLFDLNADPLELRDISKEHLDICNEMESMLLSKYHYEEVDCRAKHLQYQLFDEYFWRKFDETELRKQCEKRYSGFNDSDWMTLMEWKQEMETAPSCDEISKMSPPLKYHQVTTISIGKDQAPITISENEPEAKSSWIGQNTIILYAVLFGSFSTLSAICCILDHRRRRNHKQSICSKCSYDEIENEEDQ